ncbi:uncharacterized protein LOC129235604 isoform X1 [Anastrepha obliqua]|uniref:uncharacterized protein LOC129235604 isoform X1 n=1 Tax=Anastrepha obliqua TaxID=95512 RepID=UPI00240A1CDD|nr:uncharacterized protein LOC129235604 isoform X1 [Anastrepha obliqua]
MKALEGPLMSVMDLSIASNGNKVKEKRERQPNWTEAEKQLLLSLTRIHKVILENKGSDTMTIKKKSEAWDDIATNMRSAGYQRSKDRLKQQLGRIRAAEAKKAKDALAKSQPLDNSLAIAGCSLESSGNDEYIPHNMKLGNFNFITAASLNRQSIRNMPTPMHEVAIKIEKAISLEDFDTLSNGKQPNKNPNDVYGLSDLSSQSPIPVIHELNKRMCQGPQYLSLNQQIVGEDGASESECQLPPISSTSQNSHFKCHCNHKKLKHVRLRINGYAPRTRAQRARQLHLYRVAVEKERLKMLRLQQKRDRIFYRKDKEIQNLKLQILSNLAVNRINHINFT